MNLRQQPETPVGLGRRARPTCRHRRAWTIPHITVEQFDFFRRQEIKDLLARLRLLLNPANSGTLKKAVHPP